MLDLPCPLSSQKNFHDTQIRPLFTVLRAGLSWTGCLASPYVVKSSLWFLLSFSRRVSLSDLQMQWPSSDYLGTGALRVHRGESFGILHVACSFVNKNLTQTPCSSNPTMGPQFILFRCYSLVLKLPQMVSSLISMRL